MKKLRSFALYALVTPAIALGASPLLAEQQSTQSDQSEQLSETSEQLSDTADKLSDTARELSDTAEQPSATSDQDVDQEQQSTQSDQEVTISVESSDQTESADQDVGEAYGGENTDESTQSSESADQDVGNEQKSTESDQDATQSSTKTTQSDQNTGDQPGMMSQSYMESAPANGMQANNLIGTEVRTSGDEDVGSVSDLIIDENGQVVAIVIGVGGFLGMGERDVAIGWDDVTKSGTTDELELRIDATRESLSSAPEFKAQD